MAWHHRCSHCGEQDHECYEVQCARCKSIGWSNEFVPEEGDEWECPPCNDKHNALERADQIGGKL